MIRALALALQLLTRLPIPGIGSPPRPEDLGRSVLFFPLVGLLIGALLAGLQAGLWWVDPGVLAALLLVAWVTLTGGLHLDGLADTADAWIGGQGDRERTLAIMKDPHSGPIAVVTVILLLLLKFAALQALLAGDAGFVLLLTPMLGRTILVALLLTTPYIRPDGLGMPYARALPPWSCGALIALAAAVTLLLLEWQGGLVLGALSLGLFGLRHALLMRLGGITGDTLGAACELAEAGVLLMAALSWPAL